MNVVEVTAFNSLNTLAAVTGKLESCYSDGRVYDSCEISTCPFIDADENKIFIADSDDKPIVLGDDDYVLFCVASPSGRVYLKKILTKSDYNSDGVLTMKLSPADTIDLQPFSYLFSFSYMPNKGEDCYTYATGVFNILPAVGTVRELNIPVEPDIPVEPETPENNDSSDESGDNNGN